MSFLTSRITLVLFGLTISIGGLISPTLVSAALLEVVRVRNLARSPDSTGPPPSPTNGKEVDDPLDAWGGVGPIPEA